MMRSVLAATAATFLALAAAPAAEAPKFYQLQSVLHLPSTATPWDHIDFDPAKRYAYLSRRKDGLTVVDVTTGKVVARVARTEGTNSVAFAPRHDRAYTSNEDGSTTIFRMSDFSVIDRVSFANNADGNIYDPVTDSVAFMQADDSLVVVADAATGKIRGTVKVVGTQLERPLPDGRGGIFVPMRDQHAVYRIDLKTLTIAAHWDVAPHCVEPSGADYDAVHDRLFLGCRGKQIDPQFVVLDASSGREVAALPLGRGVDGVLFDPAHKRIFTANGLDGNAVVYDQIDADHYAMQQAFTTRPGARGFVYDAPTQRLFTMTADGAVNPAKKVLKAISLFYPNTIFPNTFVMLTYGVGTPAVTQ